ncbi:nitrogenase molybdenum-iron protein beta chain [Butyrivibrio sp. ob235]|uniref:nitrogenase component 1 n=1 Tax=Butyrivibrio sp. ob235 TaxID=1761780 RepID=UPI0008B46F45|nr:nitrogenase component 1 [Butyrivibrio sp. ob235]SEL03858.1 nitrogenase molybdenum-iron protein beta chain [Butyrivibrio sp. ob235]
MEQSLEKQCVGCAISSYYTVLSIEKFLPIMHAGSGCIRNGGPLMGAQNGSQQGVGFSEGLMPSSNLVDVDIVFGGEKKLKKVIDKSLEYYDADAYVVLAGCVAAIIGDDLEEIERSYEDAEKPVLVTEVAGFKGNNIFGHEQVVKKIIDSLCVKSDKINPKQVNVWGIIPYYDPFWAGTYDAIEKMLTELGFEPNIIYGKGRGIKNIRKIPEAAFNLVLSPWWELNIAKHLKTKFGTPIFHYPVLPIGPTETTKFLRALKEYANLDESLIEDYIKKNEDKYYYYIEKGISLLCDAKVLPKRFLTIANSTYALSSAKYLINDLGLIPEKQYLSDDVPAKYQQLIIDEYQNFDGGITAEVEFQADVGKALDDVRKLREEHERVNPPVLFGSLWNDVEARRWKTDSIHISAPVGNVVILNKTYFGYSGGLTFFEDYYSVIAKRFGDEL